MGLCFASCPGRPHPLGFLSIRQGKRSFAGLKDGPSQVCSHPLMWSPFPANSRMNSWEATWGGSRAYKPVGVRLHDSWGQDREAQKESHGRS